MQCKYLIGDTRCKLRTKQPSGYCHHHNKEQTNYKFPKPKTCPVCWASIHQCIHPLECGHWVHKKCVQKSNKSECPICRRPLPGSVASVNFEDLLDELLVDPDIERIEIPLDAIVLAVLSYKLYAFILCPSNRTLGLHHFVNCSVEHIIPPEHPNHAGVTSVLYGEALQLFFNPDSWE